MQYSFHGDCRVCNSLLCAGPTLCHILRTVPSEAPRRADAVPLLAQPEAPRSHQRVQGSTVHRSASYSSIGCWTEWMWFMSVHPPPSSLPLSLYSLEPHPLSTHRVPQCHQQTCGQGENEICYFRRYILYSTQSMLQYFLFYSCSTFSLSILNVLHKIHCYYHYFLI